MKRAMLLLMALLAFAHAALAEDFSAYAVKTNGFAVFAPNPILENGDMFFKTWSDRVGTVGDGYFWHFEWMRGGSVYRDLPYEVAVDQSWSPLEFMPVGGECYVIAQTVLQEDEEGTERAVTAAVYRWTDAGVEQIAAIPDYGERTEITVLGDAFSVYKRETGMMQIYRYDGTPLQTYRFEPESTVMSVLRAKDDTLYVVNSRRYAGGDGVSTVYALKDEDVLWQREYRQYIGIRCPGDGYLYVLQKERGEKYSPIHIERVDADGSVLLSRTLSADRLVLSCGFAFQPDSGRLMIFGHGVAVSRDQYNVFVMELDQNMREVSTDVRRFYYHGDYGFSVCPMSDGRFMVFSNGTDIRPQEPSGEPVLVPFDVLERTDRNGLTLR